MRQDKDGTWQVMQGKGGLSRRSFLTGLGLAGVACAGSGLVGCASRQGGQSSSGAGSDASDATAAQANADANMEGSASPFAIAPQRIDGVKADKEYDADYVVIGSGNAGIFSAGWAAELGMKVVLLEKNSVAGGASVGTEATMAFSDFDAIAKSDYQSGTPAEIFNYFMMHESWRPNALLVSTFIDNLHRAHEWLIDNGASVMLPLPSLDSPTCAVMYEGEGPGVYEVAEKAALDRGVTQLLKTPATALLVDDNGVFAGVLADGPGGSVLVRAKACFVSTGGFGTNPQMVDHYIGTGGTIAFKRDEAIPHDGDGINMMLGMGASDYKVGQALPAASSVNGVAWEDPIDRAAREPYLWVNAAGYRLNNEKWDVMNVPYEVGIKQHGNVFYNVIDSDAVKRMQEQKLFTNPRTVLGSFDPDPTMGESLDKAAKDGLISKGDTIEELAEQAGIDPAVLRKAVARYNELCASGNDVDCYKDAAYLFPLKTAPFYAFELVPSWYSTLCGIEVSERFEVLDANGAVIPGLYAGGADAAGFFHANYNHGFSGSASAFSYTGGMCAADSAYEYVKSLS